VSQENCNKSDDKCPLTWRELQLTTQSDIRVCNACKNRRLVYLVQDLNAVKEHYEKGHLIVYNVSPCSVLD
jgi:sulfur relay (sulfurtransferase) complex TusBCD TusD component (DsrE family)